ncbi:hypothetical protein P872_12250, partial [Rhodonellum psychrophilum GCM71 = DSM 17998]
IARLNADGSLDAGFSLGTGANDRIFTASVQSNGTIIIGGSFTFYNGTAINRIARLNTDGSLDTGFNTNTGANAQVFAASIQPSGKIIIGGHFTSYNGTNINHIARLNVDGSLDTGFNSGTGPNNSVSKIFLQPNGKLIIIGLFTSYNGTEIKGIARLNADGSLDTSFNPVLGSYASIMTVAFQPDGKLIIVGSFTFFNDSKINYIARLNSDGSLDSEYNTGTGTSNTILTAFIQPDGKLVIGGQFTFYNGIAVKPIVRLNVDGTLDTDFNPEIGMINSIMTAILQPGGKIIIKGNFISLGTVTRRIARLNADGSLDTSFNDGTGPNQRVFTVTLQPDGKLLVGGDFTSYNGIALNHIARLNTDGSIDSTFNPGTGSNNTVRTAVLQPDGKIIIGGDFTSYDNVSRVRINRLLNS